MSGVKWRGANEGSQKNMGQSTVGTGTDADIDTDADMVTMIAQCDERGQIGILGLENYEE